MNLYPFLDTADASADLDLDALMDQGAESTAAKAVEIGRLRREVLRRDGRRIEACAAQMAERFAAGGRLLAYGNGGSSTAAPAAIRARDNSGKRRS